MAKLFHMIVLFMAAMSSIVKPYDVLLHAYHGLAGNNLQEPWQVVQLCLKYNIRRVRLYEPNLDVIEAFRGMGIDLPFSEPNSLITNMAPNDSAMGERFNIYIDPFIGDFIINYIIVGDEAIPGLDNDILPVMKS
ncbi:glucan endo-1,3-beta-glucosidase-like [Benincasa hispida]|uniref:glucan endo-1,3-beta-glucosidase-like n=1 Tax=Benincasa hispida TaxID=102211 RepID=UPI0019025177|nr:glucan endo-1,3-beta-glucosidase-like [Benincasa hispida]